MVGAVHDGCRGATTVYLDRLPDDMIPLAINNWGDVAAVFWTPQDGTYTITELPGHLPNPQAINDQGIGMGYAMMGRGNGSHGQWRGTSMAP